MGNGRGEIDMGTILEFPAVAVAQRPGTDVVAPGRTATILILPVIRIERHADTGSSDGPKQGDAPKRRRRRRLRS